jgi:hypothetical protein
MRGASNVYFHVTATALSIPPVSTACKQAVGDIWLVLRPVIDAFSPDNLPPQIVEIARNAKPQLRRYSDEAVLEAIRGLAKGESGGAGLPTTDAEQRRAERHAIVTGLSDEDASGHSLFQSQPVERDAFAAGGPLLASAVGSLALVHRLREVRVLRGFQRLEPPLGDPFTLPCAPLSRGRLSWLPAVQVYGEGIYFELASDPLSAWQSQAPVRQRVDGIRAKFALVRPDADSAFITPQFLLMHSLTHLLINQLALDCGYSSSSLRERIYAGSDSDGAPWAGALIYTSSASSDGTLGGLVRQGEPDLFGRTLVAAVENAEWCSSDPLCIESTGQGVDALNLAACHACAIVSETSCEHRNAFLDRALITGTPNARGLGFFNDRTSARP